MYKRQGIHIGLVIQLFQDFFHPLPAGLGHTATPVKMCIRDRVLRERPAGMYVAFHAPTDMLVQLHGADAYFPVSYTHLKTAAKVEFSAERMKSFSTFCLSLCLQKNR